MPIKIKRAYDPAEKSDGFRVLVDRIWPRGVTKTDAQIDLWLKEIAPTTTLRKWFAHDPEKWDKFRERYFRELDKNRAAVEKLAEQTARGTITLVYGAKDEQHNQAAALKEYLTKR